MNIRRCILTTIVSLFFSFVSFGQTEITPVYLKFRADKVYILEGERIEIVADLYVGTWENPVQNLYAATFNLVFPADVVLAESTSFSYEPQSFLGKKEDVTILNKAPETLKEGRLNISFSRSDGKSVNGFGKIGEIRFITNSDIIGSRNIEETPFTVKPESIKLWNLERNELPHEADENGATIIIVNDILARGQRLSGVRQVEVYPNPVRDILFINLQNVQGERLEIFNATGQRVKGDQVQGDQVQISTKDLRPGLYIVKIHTEEGIITRRVVLQ
jgi:hypothetical protein